MRIIVVLSLSFLLFCQSARAQGSAVNAQEFIAREGGGSSGGAGNGGNNLVSIFYRQALIGLQYLKLTRLLDEQKLAAIHNAIRSSKVFPVSFQLCALDSDSSCSDEAAMASKNYSDRKIILVDARPLPHRFSKMTQSEQRRHAVHEFAGLAGIELSNHHFTSTLDSIDLYEKFSSRNQMKEYFNLLGSLFLSLPTSSLEEYVGEWRKATAIQRGRHRTVNSYADLIKGKGYGFHFDLGTNTAASSGADGLACSYDYHYKVSGDGWVYEPSLSDCKVSEFGLQCGDPGEKNWRRVLARHEKKFPEMFAPMELQQRTEVYPLVCKVWNEGELICRHFYWHWLPYSPVQTLLWTHEYAFLTRSKVPLSKLVFKAEHEKD